MKELLELLKRELIERIDSTGGICTTVNVMFFHGILDQEETTRLRAFLRGNLPERRPGYNFCWKAHELRPRIEWIDKMIEEWNN